MNKFFIAIMEGKIARGHESFSDFLIERLHDSPRIAPECRQLFELYIAPVYGDATKERVVPLAFARELGFYIEDTGRMQHVAEEAFPLEKEEFLKRRWDYFY